MGDLGTEAMVPCGFGCSRLGVRGSPLRRKNPPITCLGRARVGNQWVYRFSLLTLLFSGAMQTL